MEATKEDFEERCDRIHREWLVLSKRARAWCNAKGHSMGPLHQHSTYDRIENPRVMVCRRCHMRAWVRLDADLYGLPSYKECYVEKAIREFKERRAAREAL